MRQRIVLTIGPGERNALLDLAQLEDRDPKRQAHRLLREGLIRAGVLHEQGVSTDLKTTDPRPAAALARP